MTAPDMAVSPPKILNAHQVNDLLPQLDVKAELTQLFRALGQGGAVQPAQTITDFPQSKGDYITYLGAIADAGVFGAKLSPYIVRPGRPIITAWTNLMSMETGQPLLWCDAGALTTERTAGTTALAVDFLAKSDARKLAIIGSGAVAQAHYRHVKNLREWGEVRVYSPSLVATSERAEKWRALCPDIEMSSSADACIKDADVIMLCTSSGTAIIDHAAVKQSAVVTSISTNVANAHEVSPTFLSAADVYCDYRLTTPGSAGEMRLAKQDHGWDANNICGDLPELVCGTCPKPSYERPVFFRSIGLGLEDIAMAHGLWKLVKND